MEYDDYEDDDGIHIIYHSKSQVTVLEINDVSHHDHHGYHGHHGRDGRFSMLLMILVELSFGHPR